MKARVYIETTFVSYLTAWPSRDVVIAGHQQITHEWWQKCRERFELCVSELVTREASAGDAQAAQERLSVLAPMTLLANTEEAVSLAEKLIEAGCLPAKAAEDALHLAIAAVNGIDYLLTWNCKHLANAALWKQIEAVCRAAGHAPSIICTPEELLGE